MLDAGLGRGGNGCLVLRQALAWNGESVGGNDEQRVDPLECRLKRGCIVEIGSACLHTLCGETGELARIAAGRNDAGRRNLIGFQEMTDDSLAEMTRGAGHENLAHNICPLLVSKRE